jgi:hypothetical protein
MLPDFDRPDRRVLGEPGKPHSRRTPDRLRGGPDAEGGARRDVAGSRAVGPSLRLIRERARQSNRGLVCARWLVHNAPTMAPPPDPPVAALL